MSEVTIYCPPTGTTITGECYTTEVLSWTGDSVSYIQFFVPTIDDTLIKFDLTNITNNGSNVELDLVYWVDGVYGVVQSWNLGTISSSTYLYHYLDFGTTLGLNNYITLQFNITGGTTGQIDITLECDVDVAKELFCSGTTFTEACDCENEVTLYTDTNQTSLFQFQGMSWYLDANLQTEAPCGNYVPKKLDSSLNLKNRYINYYYDCVTHLPIIYGYCTTPCSQIACSGGTSTYEHSGNTYAFANPLIETDKRLNSQTIVDPPLNFPNTNSFSKHCVTIEFPQGSNGIYSITIGYTGTSLPERYITFEDAAYYQTKQSPGQLSFNTLLPSNSPWFIPIAADLLIPFTDTVTFYVIPPKSGLVTVKFMIGSSKRPFTKPSLVTTSITPSCTSVPIYKYNAGLHVYSAYDSIISPRLTTTVYSLTPLASWQVDSTKIFNDNYFVQPAFPYWYSISGTTYKVGEPLRRDWGAVHQYEVKKKLASRLRNVNVNKITGPYQNQIITDLFSGQRTLPSCIHILGTVGILREKVPQIEVIQPTKYKYFVGVSPFPNTTLITNKLASNDNYFTLIDAEFALSRDNCYPVTGFEHAAVKLGEAYSIMISPYLSNYIGANEFYQNLTKELKGSIIGRSNLIFGIAVSITILITVGFMSDQNAGYGNLGLFNGSGKSALDRYNELPEYKKGSTPESLKCPKWANGLPGVKESITYLFNNPKIALAIAVVIGLATFLQWFIPINKIVSECCKLLKVVNTNNPYIFIGDTIYLNQNMTTPFTSGWVCDGAYFYKIVDGAVLDKEISFTYHGVQYSPGGGIGLGTGPKVPSLIPDSPLYVTNITKLFFLPYVSGVPDGFTTNPLYSSAAISGKSFTDASVTGALYKPLENEYILEQGYFTSEISQLDADTKAINYFNTVTAQTQDVFGGLTYGPNIAYEPSIFSHEIKIENSPRQLDLFFDNTDLSGITIGKTVYLDLGYSEALTGYYSLSSDTVYRKFCLVLSGSVTDIYSMESASSTTVTSLLSGNTVNISQTYKDFTSGWYKKAFQPINNTLLKTPWNSSGFYSSDEITRGFVNTTSSAETFYTYSTKNGLASAFTEAESSYYQEIMAVQEQFFYYQPRTLIIDSVQVCSFTGSGVDFRVKDISGQTTNAEFGISFNAVIYTASTYDSTHSISIQSGEESKLLVLPFEYNGQITDVVISGYTSPNPVNKITYTAGTFTSCVTPSPTPTPTITSTQTPTPTITSTITPTPTITPTITTTPAPPFVSTWRTTGFSESITLPYWSASTSYDGIIDWGDGTQVSNSFANRTHTYTNPGDYEVKIYGTVSGWTFGQYPGNSVSKDNIISISQWGPLRLGRTAIREFFQCTNLSLSGVTDVLDLTGKLYLFQTFTLSYGSITTIGRINEWNTSSIINMRDCFRYTSFNDDITTWDVSNNQAFTYMVADTPFNQDISGWNVSKGVLFNGMFSNTPFNYNISSWNVSAATNMDSMFFNNTVFNQDISVWNVSNVTNMRFLFGGAQSFNQPVGVWNVDKVTNMYGMFTNAFNFNQDLSSWNTSKVTNMAYMFSQATDFDRNIGNWNVSGVTNFIDFMALKTDSDFSFTNLDSIYNGWSSQNVKTGITINFGTIKFSQNGLAGKQVLTGSPYNWIITDGGMIDFTPTPTPTITETMTPTPTITETMTPTPTPTEQVPTIYLNFCYDANIPEDFAVDVYVYSQTTPSGCGQNQTQVQEVLNITTTIISDSGFSEGYIFTLNPGESCALTSGSVVGSLIDNFIVDSVSPTGSTFANYVVGQICSSGSCITCSGSTPTPTPSMTETPTPTPSMTETPTPTPTLTSTPAEVVSTPTPTPTPTSTVPQFVCNDCRNWQYNSVPLQGDVIHYYSCIDGSPQSIGVNDGDTGTFCNCNSVANPYTDNGTQLTEIGICVTPTPTPSQSYNPN